MYQKKINASGLAKMSLPFYTARDAEKSLDVEGMAEIYEKARYSDVGKALDVAEQTEMSGR